jgi:hypothetical protein
MKAATVAVAGHAAAVVMSIYLGEKVVFNGQSAARLDSACWYLLAISGLLALAVYIIVGSKRLSYHPATKSAGGACLLATAALIPFFLGHGVLPYTLAMGTVGSAICFGVVLVNRFDVYDRAKDRVLSYAEPPTDSEVIHYLELEAKGWQSLSLQLVVVGATAYLGLLHYAPEIARWSSSDPASQLSLINSMGLMGFIYLALFSVYIVGGTWVQARIARAEIMSAGVVLEGLVKRKAEGNLEVVGKPDA